MDTIEEYAQRQRSIYERHTTSRTDAEAMVGARYPVIRQQANWQAQFIMNEYLRRRPNEEPVDLDLRILDFGCGVGRMMEAFAGLGFRNIDGVDISENMLTHAGSSPALQGSQFWSTNGHDCGEAPPQSYDLVYSLITMHHICMRQTRIDILRAMHRSLRPGGVVALEFFSYPGATAARVPRNHATWDMNMTAEDTNSRADVWITADQLGLVYNDLRLFFRDVQFQEFDAVPSVNSFAYDAEQIYQYPRNRFLVVAAKSGELLHKFVGPRQ